MFAGTKLLNVPLWLLMTCIFGAAVLGPSLGYLTGYYFGAKIKNRPDSLFFKQKYIDNTRDAFVKYGNGALIISRFLPIVRTFAPLLAGLIHMPFQFFMLYNIVGGAIWVLTLVGGGFFFGERFPWIVDYVQYIIIFFLAITTFTVIKGYLNARKRKKPRMFNPWQLGIAIQTNPTFQSIRFLHSQIPSFPLPTVPGQNRMF